jgi:hypothetical protein
MQLTSLRKKIILSIFWKFFDEQSWILFEINITNIDFELAFLFAKINLF